MPVVPDFELIPGTIICLHLPVGGDYPADDLVRQLRRLADLRSKRVCIAADCEFGRGSQEFNRDQTCVDWLAEKARLSVDEAAAIIRGFTIPVAPLLCQNAANPRRFLGVAAALAGRPGLLVYETSGMDPRGRYRLHEYVAERGLELCAVHISYASVYGTGLPAPRICPTTAKCMELDGNP